MTCVCSVGLDMIALTGDVTPATLSGIIADEAAIGMINKKTTAVRIIPVIGKKEGEMVEFGGLLGRAPVMGVNPFSSEKMINAAEESCSASIINQLIGFRIIKRLTKSYG